MRKALRDIGMRALSPPASLPHARHILTQFPIAQRGKTRAASAGNHRLRAIPNDQLRELGIELLKKPFEALAEGA